MRIFPIGLAGISLVVVASAYSATLVSLGIEKTEIRKLKQPVLVKGFDVNYWANKHTSSLAKITKLETTLKDKQEVVDFNVKWLSHWKKKFVAMRTNRDEYRTNRDEWKEHYKNRVKPGYKGKMASYWYKKYMIALGVKY